MSEAPETVEPTQLDDEAHLARLGYKQELSRTPGTSWCC